MKTVPAASAIPWLCKHWKLAWSISLPFYSALNQKYSHKESINCTATSHTHKNPGVQLRMNTCPSSAPSCRPRRCEAHHNICFTFCRQRNRRSPLRERQERDGRTPGAGSAGLKQVLRLHMSPSSSYCPHFPPNKINWGLEYSATEVQRVKAETMWFCL